MGDTMEAVRLVIFCNVEAAVNVRVQLLVSKSWFAKGGHARMPSTCLEVKTSQSRNGTTQRMSNEHQLIVGVLLQSIRYVWKDDFARVQPRRVEARVHCAVGALRWLSRRWVSLRRSGRLQVGREEVVGGAIMVVARVGYVFLRDSREICDGVGDRIGPAKGEDESRVSRGMRQGNVAAGVREEGPCVPCLNCQ